MKRLLGIISSVFVLLAGAASVQAKCQQMGIISSGEHALPSAGHAHDHRPGSNHDHEHTAVHCPTDHFVPTASLSAKPTREAKRLADSFTRECAWANDDCGRSAAGPTISTPAQPTISFHLLLSVLRI